MSDPTDPTGFQVWYRYGGSSPWFPLHETPEQRPDCEIDCEVLGAQPNVQDTVILPWGEVPDPKRLSQDDPLTIQLLREWIE
jgi:hypothetical protein